MNNDWGLTAFLAKFVPKSPTIYLFFTPGKMMLQIQRAVSRASAVILGHSHNSDVQRQVADILYAKATADGRLSASIGGLFPTGGGSDHYTENAFTFHSGGARPFVRSSEKD